MKPLRLAVLVSGAGRTLQNLAERIERGTLPAVIDLVICSRRGVAGIDVAKKHNLPLALVPRAEFPDDAAYGAAVASHLEKTRADLVVLAGFLHYLVIPPRFQGRVLNIHPALLPKFGGKGFYGERVHKAVLKAGERESGCTVHWVDDVYDHGKILLQKRVPVLADDTPHTLAARVFEQECEALPEALTRLAEQLKR